MHETLTSGTVNESHDVVVVAVDVEERDRFVEDAQLCEDHHFEQLVHGAHAAWHGDEGIGHVFKDLLAFGHRVDHNQLVNVGAANAHVQEVLRDGAHDAAAALFHHLGDDVHQAYVAPTVKQLTVVVGQNVAQFSRLLTVNRVEAHAAAAKNTNLLHSVNFCKGKIFYLCNQKNNNGPSTSSGTKGR